MTSYAEPFDEAQFIFLQKPQSLKNGVFWDVTRCGSCKNRRSEELSASFIIVITISEVGTTLRRNIAAWVGCHLQLALFLLHRFCHPDEVGAKIL
jgi:hypothetical protein